MTYTEWRDELKNNLLSVSEAERRRVLDYYAEAYADRREAGFSEREIISEFGAPYDAAQRILHESDDFGYSEAPKSSHFGDSDESRRSERYADAREERRAEREEARCERREERSERREAHEVRTAKKREDYTWVFVLLCIILAGPLFGLIMTMVGITIGLGVAPFSLLLAGIAEVCKGVGSAFTDFALGLRYIGVGLIQTGIAVVLFPLCFWLIRLMWRLFKKLFRWIKSLFSGKEVA